MRPSAWNSLTLATALSLATSCTTTVPVNPGFFPMDSAAAPDWMAHRSESIFRVRVPVSRGRGWTNLNSGTAFLAGGLLWTAKHLFVLDPDSKDHRKGGRPLVHELREGRTIRLTLLDREGNMKWTSRFGTAEIAVVGEHAEMHSPEAMAHRAFFGLGEADFIGIRLTPPLHAPDIPVALPDALPDDPCYLGGFPSKTTGRAPFAPDSDGVRFSWTTGRTFDGNLIEALYEPSRGDCVDVPVFQRCQLASSADCTHGLSGAPMLDRFGHLVGLFCETLPDPPDRGEHPGPAIGVRWSFVERRIAALAEIPDER